MAVLADGMGGRSGGAMAAEQVIRTAKQNFDLFSPLTDTIDKMVQTIAHEAHTVIKLNAISSEKQPHSTMVVLVITPEKTAVWAHVGDSRLYRFSGPNFAERTIDHSYVEQLIAKGKLAREDAKDHKLSNILVNVLGSPNAEPFVTVGSHQGLKVGDAFLLCSDGLWTYFSDGELGAALAMNSPRLASEMLIKKARERAEGTVADNCTLAIIKLVEQPKETPSYTAQKMRRAV
jgi:serine/threonine protein phosphatase PrpC